MGALAAETEPGREGGEPPRPWPINRAVAAKLADYGDLLAQQGEDGFRSRAYRRAAEVVAGLDRPVDRILAAEGRAGLVALPAVGVSIAAAIAEIVTTGRWSQLERLRGELAPEALFQTIPGVGPALAGRLAGACHLESLEELEHALHFGKTPLPGIGDRRKRMIAAALSERLGRLPSRGTMAHSLPPIAMLLAVDEDYRRRAARGELRRIAPRRFNPTGEAWLPILHMRKGDWNFTALFSNTRLAHETGRTGDWVVIYHQRDGEAEGRSTVVTAHGGALDGHRVVRGREFEQLEKGDRT